MRTSVDNVSLVQIVNCLEDLFYSLRSIFLGELALVADTVEQLAASRQLGHDVKFVLFVVSPGSTS